MSDITLKSITFPELGNKYTLPQTDTTLSVSGSSADAKATGDAIAAETTRTDTLLNGKADKDGNYTDLTAGTALAVLSDSYTVDAVPYKFRRTPYKSRRLMDEIVGGTVAWNQLINVTAGSGTVSGISYEKNTNGKVTMNGTSSGIFNIDIGSSISVIKDRVYLPLVGNLLSRTSGDVIMVNSWASIFPFGSPQKCTASTTGLVSVRFNNGITLNGDYYIQLFDLTAMFGTTIADYLYQLEQTTAGAGVAMFRSMFAEDYYAYNAGELVSIEGLSAHVMRDAGNNVIGNYALGDSLTLRGIPKLVDSKIKFDGDRYASDGTVTRRYGIVDLGTLSWTARTDVAQGMFSARIDNRYQGATAQAMCAKYPYNGTVPGVTAAVTANPSFSFYNGGTSIYVYDTAYTDAATFKTAMSGVYLLYELATYTTEQADPYVNPQICSASGTEEYISETVVPVGHESRYYRDIIGAIEDIPDLPTTAGNYVLKVTVSGGVPTYSWVTA